MAFFWSNAEEQTSFWTMKNCCWSFFLVSTHQEMWIHCNELTYPCHVSVLWDHNRWHLLTIIQFKKKKSLNIKSWHVNLGGASPEMQTWNVNDFIRRCKWLQNSSSDIIDLWLLRNFSFSCDFSKTWGRTETNQTPNIWQPRQPPRPQTHTWAEPIRLEIRKRLMSLVQFRDIMNAHLIVKTQTLSMSSSHLCPIAGDSPPKRSLCLMWG